MPIGNAAADQDTINFYLCLTRLCEESDGPSYHGTGYDALFWGDGDDVAGAVREAGGDVVDDTYDGWGNLYGAANILSPSPYIGGIERYDEEFNGLGARRWVDSYEAEPGLPVNSVRWFDSFTNNTSDTIVANIGFGGDLGSDEDTFIHAQGQGYIVTGENKSGSTDPIIAHIYGNNTYAFSQISQYFEEGTDEGYFVFPISVAPGQTVSILNVNLLFGDLGRENDPNDAFYAADVALAIQESQLFINSPIFAGLSAAQVESLINWGTKDADAVAAGGMVALSQRLHEAFDLTLARGFAPTGQATAQLASGALQYAEENTTPSDGAAALARSIGDAGGKVAISGFDGSRAFLFGGYTTGSQDFSAGQLDFSGYVTGLGVEHTVSPDLLLGLASGYARGNGDIAGVYSDIENRQFTASPYLRWQAPTGTVFDARLSASTERWDYARTAGAGTASAEIDGYSFGANIAASHDIEMGWAKVTPFANLSYLRTHVDAYEETGAAQANLAVPSYDVDRLETVAGIGASRQWLLDSGAALRGFGSIGLGGAFLGNDEAITSRYTTSATAFLSQVETGEGAFGRVEAGLAVDFTSRLSLTSAYAGSFGADRDQHTFNVGFAGKL